MKRAFCQTVCSAVIGIVLLMGASLPAQGELLKSVKFLSGPAGTTWYSQVAAFSGIASDKLKMNVDVLTGSAISNPILMERGRAELGLTFSSYMPAMSKGKVVATIGKDRYFTEPLKNVKVLAYTTIAACVLIVDANSPYEYISDLRDQPVRYVTYPSGFTARYVPERMLEAHGVTHEGIEKAGGKVDIVSRYTEACDLLAKGQADVIAYSMAVRSQAAALSELEAQKKFRILKVKEDVAANILEEIPLIKTQVKKGLHQSITEDTTVLADVTVWLVHAKVPDETVVAILDTLLKNMDTMALVGNIEFKDFTAKDLCRLHGKGGQLPLHPAALKFYKEKGAIE